MLHTLYPLSLTTHVGFDTEPLTERDDRAAMADRDQANAPEVGERKPRSAAIVPHTRTTVAPSTRVHVFVGRSATGRRVAAGRPAGEGDAWVSHPGGSEADGGAERASLWLGLGSGYRARATVRARIY